MLSAKEKDLATELQKAKQKDKIADSEEALDAAIAMNKREMHQLNELVRKSNKNNRSWKRRRT